MLNNHVNYKFIHKKTKICIIWIQYRIIEGRWDRRSLNRIVNRKILVMWDSMECKTPIFGSLQFTPLTSTRVLTCGAHTSS